MKAFFLNASQNREGRTAAMGRELFGSVPFTQLNLVDFTLGGLGQELPKDQYGELWAQIIEADLLVLGTPVYWHAGTGLFHIFLDRLVEQETAQLRGKRLILLYQGFDPAPVARELLTQLAERLASSYGMELLGVVSDDDEVQAMSQRLLDIPS